MESMEENYNKTVEYEKERIVANFTAHLNSTDLVMNSTANLTDFMIEPNNIVVSNWTANSTSNSTVKIEKLKTKKVRSKKIEKLDANSTFEIMNSTQKAHHNITLETKDSWSTTIKKIVTLNSEDIIEFGKFDNPETEFEWNTQ